MSTRWHVLRDGKSVTLCRHLPPRLDFSVQTVLPQLSPVRLAHQIRQDLWRALQNVRGFSPVVRLDAAPDGWVVTAGGRTATPLAQAVHNRAADVLNNPENRTRWARSARVAR